MCVCVCVCVFCVLCEDEAVVNLQRSLNFQLGEVQSCHTDLGQLVHSLQRELSSLETSQVAVAKQLKPLFEKMMLVKISADTLLKVSVWPVGLTLDCGTDLHPWCVCSGAHPVHSCLLYPL